MDVPVPGVVVYDMGIFDYGFFEGPLIKNGFGLYNFCCDCFLS